MRVSLKWLRDYVDFDLSPEDLAHRLTMAGLEVSSITRTGGSWGDAIQVGHVRDLIPHPNADRLRLATVHLGTETLTVVCGAPNIEAGQKIVLARVGARVTDSDSGREMTLKAARIRGVVSEGMVCSERELGLGHDHSGIIVLPADAPPGVSLDDYLGDVVLDIDVTPNRPDWLSIIGIAWEVAAVTGGTVRMPDTTYREDGSPIAGLPDLVAVGDPDLAPRYTVSLVAGLAVAPSPGWMQLRLQSAGIRPISNVVDITNYVMLEFGQPLHSFDRAGLRGGGVAARRAREGEQLITLDGRSHALTTEDLVIADGSGPVGLAGVMGGSSTEVSQSTTEIVLESASFSGVGVRKTVQRHRIEVGGKRGTEASHRFERGLPIELAPEALRRATKLLVEICNGTAAQGIVDAYPTPSPRPVVTLTSQRVRRVLGVDLGMETVARTLRSLGFVVTDSGPGEPDGFQVTTPFWRSDIAIPEDLIEEVARVVGYDAIPTTLPAATLMDQQSDPRRELKEAARDALVGLGLQETISYPLVSAASLALTAPEGTATPLTIVNRMSPDQEALRTTLRGSLLRTYAQNERSNRADSLRLFEIGRTYIQRADDLPIEHEIAAAVVGGQRSERTWHGDESGGMDFFDAKGLVEALLERVGISADFSPTEDRALAPGRTARITVGEDRDPIGFIGEVHPDILVAMDIREPRVMLFEVDLDAALRHRSRRLRTWRTVSRYPGLVRDLAFVVNASASAGPIDRILRDFPAVAESSLVDVYVGSQVPDGKKSLAFRIVWQSPTRTLTDAEVEIAQAQLFEKLERETGAVLRS